MSNQTCDCCGKPVREFSRVYLGRVRVEWGACVECTNKIVPLVLREPDIPLLSVIDGGK